MKRTKKRLEKEQQVAAIFEPYYTARSESTQKRQRKELASLSAFAQTQGVVLGDLLAESTGWAQLTNMLILAYLEHLKVLNYKDSSIALQGYTFKRYARLAMEAGALLGSIYEAIDAISISSGESEVVYLSLTDEQVQQLLAQPLQSQRGSRDALCMALLLLCGLWPRSIVALNRSSFDLSAKTITFYDYHARQWQMWRLDSRTLALVTHYLAFSSPYEALLIGNHRPASSSLRWTDRALNYRVQELGERSGLRGLLPRDCHRYWQNTFADAATQSLVASWEGEPPAEEDGAWGVNEAQVSGRVTLLTRADSIAAHFRQWAEEIQAISQEANSLVDHYPRFCDEPGYGSLLMHLREAAAEATGLEDYVRHATDEDWRRRR